METLSLELKKEREERGGGGGGVKRKLEVELYRDSEVTSRLHVVHVSTCLKSFEYDEHSSCAESLVST